MPLVSLVTATGHGALPLLRSVAAAHPDLRFELVVVQDGGDQGAYAIQHELQDKMQTFVGIVRSEEEMKKGLAAVHALKERSRKVAAPGNREYNPGWHTALDLENLLTVSEAVALAAIERKESRGGHFREDHPDKDPAFGAINVIVCKERDGGMAVSRAPLAEMPAELKAIIDDMK